MKNAYLIKGECMNINIKSRNHENYGQGRRWKPEDKLGLLYRLSGPILLFELQSRQDGEFTGGLGKKKNTVSYMICLIPKGKKKHTSVSQEQQRFFLQTRWLFVEGHRVRKKAK